MKEEAHQIKLIALDMDGTLLNERGVLSEESRRVLEQAMEQGIHVVIATGRVLSSLPGDVLSVPGIEFAITSNGANVVRLRDRATLYSNLIKRECVEEVIDILEAPDIMTEIFFNHDVYADKDCLDHLERFGIMAEKSRNYVLSTRKPVESVTKLFRESNVQLESINLIFREEKRRREIRSRLETMKEITITTSMPNNIEIGGATTSKADGLAHLAELLGVKREQIMACGDSENDIAMLRYAGLSVAMGNAVPAVREAADVITGNNSEDGVAQAIRRYVFK